MVFRTTTEMRGSCFVSFFLLELFFSFATSYTLHLQRILYPLYLFCVRILSLKRWRKNVKFVQKSRPKVFCPKGFVRSLSSENYVLTFSLWKWSKEDPYVTHNPYRLRRGLWEKERNAREDLGQRALASRLPRARDCERRSRERHTLAVNRRDLPARVCMESSPRHVVRNSSLARQREKPVALECATHTLEPACKLFEPGTLPSWKSYISRFWTVVTF